MPDDFGRSTNHQAVPPLEAPHSTAGAAVHEVHSALGEPRRTHDGVAEPGVATVDYDVAGVQLRDEHIERRIDHRGGHHEPHDAGFRESCNEVTKLRCARSAFAGQTVHRRWCHVVDHAVVAAVHEPANHVGAHAPEPDHPQLHSRLLDQIP